MSNSEPTYFCVTPPPKSLLSDWLGRGIGDVFVLKVPQGGVVDLDLEHLILDGEVGGTTSTATSVLGQVYGMPLDGSADTMQPIGLVTTT